MKEIGVRCLKNCFSLNKLRAIGSNYAVFMVELERILIEEEDPLYQTILTLMIIISVLLIIIVAMQPSKTNAANSLSGGAEQLFGKTKARGFEAFLIRVTVGLGAIFMILAVALAYISSK